MKGRRRKRILLLLTGLGLILGGIGFLAKQPSASRQALADKILGEKLPISQDSLEELRKRVLGAAGVSAPEKKGDEEKEASRGNTILEKEIISVITSEQGTVQEKTAKIVEIIKKLPEEEAKRVKAEIRKQVCEEFLKEE